MLIRVSMLISLQKKKLHINISMISLRHKTWLFLEKSQLVSTLVLVKTDDIFEFDPLYNLHLCIFKLL